MSIKRDQVLKRLLAALMHLAAEGLWALEHEAKEDPPKPRERAEDTLTPVQAGERQRTCQRCESKFNLDSELAFYTGKAWIGACCLVKMTADELSILSLEV